MPPVPYKWTQDLWNEAFLGCRDRFDCLILITSVHERYELRRAKDSFDTSTEYFGRLTSEPGSLLNLIGVVLELEIDPNFYQWAPIPASAVGFAATQEWTDTYKRPCYLSVTVRTTEIGALQFAKVFHRAKANGQEFVPLWLRGDEPAPPIKQDSFTCLQPLSSVAFQQKVSFIGKPNQDTYELWD